MLGQTERINVGRLVVEGPSVSREHWFNPEVEITESKWEMLADLLPQIEMDDVHPSVYDQVAAAIKIMSPDRFEQLNIKVPVFEWNDYIDGRVVNKDDWAASFKLAYGQRDFGISKKYLIDLVVGTTNLNRYWHLWNLKVLYPETQFDELDLMPVQEQALKESVFYDVSWLPLRGSVARLWFGKGETVTDKWKNLCKRWLNSYFRPNVEKGDDFNFLLYAQGLAVMSADHVILDGKGMRLIFEQERRGGAIPDLPEQRRF